MSNPKEFGNEAQLTKVRLQDLECVGCQFEQQKNSLWRRQPAGIVYRGNSLCQVHFTAVMAGDRALMAALGGPKPQ